MATAPVAYEDRSDNFDRRVRDLLQALGSDTPAEDVRVMHAYVERAKVAGLDPQVVASTVYVSLHAGRAELLEAGESPGFRKRFEGGPVRMVTGKLGIGAQRVREGSLRGIHYEVYLDRAMANHGGPYAAVVWSPYDSPTYGVGVEGEVVRRKATVDDAVEYAKKYIDDLAKHGEWWHESGYADSLAAGDAEPRRPAPGETGIWEIKFTGTIGGVPVKPGAVAYVYSDFREWAIREVKSEYPNVQIISARPISRDEAPTELTEHRNVYRYRQDFFGGSEERPSAPGYYAVFPSGKLAGGPFANRHEAEPEAKRVNGYVQFEAGESAQLSHIRVDARPIPGKRGIYLVKSAPGGQMVVIGPDGRHVAVAKSWREVDHAIALADCMGGAEKHAAGACECSVVGVSVVAMEPFKKILRWHMDPKKDQTYYADAGSVGRFLLVRRSPDRRNQILPWHLSLNGHPLNHKKWQGFDTKSDAQSHAAKYAKSPTPLGTPVPALEAQEPPPRKSDCIAIVERVPGCSKVGPIADSARDVYKIMKSHFARLGHEAFFVILVNVQGYSIGSPIQVASGQRARVAVDVEQILAPVIKGVEAGCASFWICHGHPSGMSSVSTQDKQLTKAVRDAAKIACPETEFKGHVVVGSSDFKLA